MQQSPLLGPQQSAAPPPISMHWTGSPQEALPWSLALITNHSIPYNILILNYILFQLTRNLIVDKLFGQVKTTNNRQEKSLSTKTYLIKVLIYELLATCELCASCAELNVIYEKHGSLAYGLSLFVISYFWIDAFGEAHTTPCYLMEEYVLDKGNSMLKSGEFYARSLAQSLAIPLAWRLASVYWRYHLLNEHSSMLQIENCRTSLITSSWYGFAIELTCCLICRLAELCGQRLVEQKYLAQKSVGLICAFIGSLLVVLALELSGGYFNPILAASLEFGCRGIDWHQHALVFWLGPLLGHIAARLLFRRYVGERGPSKERSSSADGSQTSVRQQQLARSASSTSRRQLNEQVMQSSQNVRRSANRSSARKKSRSDKID